VASSCLESATLQSPTPFALSPTQQRQLTCPPPELTVPYEGLHGTPPLLISRLLNPRRLLCSTWGLAAMFQSSLLSHHLVLQQQSRTCQVFTCWMLIISIVSYNLYARDVHLAFKCNIPVLTFLGPSYLVMYLAFKCSTPVLTFLGPSSLVRLRTLGHSWAAWTLASQGKSGGRDMLLNLC